MSTFYEVLGVPPTAPAKDIKRKYRKLVMKYHPDRNKDPDAPRMFNNVQQAYDTLIDEGLRAHYDAALGGDDSGWNDAVARQTPLMRACEAGDEEEVKRLLAEGADVDARDAMMQTALLHAAGVSQGKFADQHGNVQCLKAMLGARADPDAMSDEGHTAISLVCEAGDPGICMMLLTRKANPNAVHDDARIPLVCAAESNNAKVVKALLAIGAKPRNTEEGGLTALMVASEAGNDDMVKYLLEARADPRTQTSIGENALLFAVEGGVTGRLPEADAISVTKRLLEGMADPFATMLNQMTPIRMAAKNNNSVFSNLLTDGAAKQALATKAPGCFDACGQCVVS